jgi:hypothetical protein
MATQTVENRPRLTPAVVAVLDALRARIRWYIWLQGLTTAAAWLALSFWISLAIDYCFEPVQSIRAVVLIVSLLVAAGIVVYLILMRAFVPMSRDNMAMVLERRFSTFDDSLLTSVELTARELDPAKCNPDMLARTCREAAERIRGVQLRRVFNPVPLGWSAGGAALLLGSIVCCLSISPDIVNIWARRSLLFSDEAWPRTTRLEQVGFANGVEKVAKGEDLTIFVKADTAYPRIPRQVEIRYAIEGGTRGREGMDREGRAESGKDPYQLYSYTFKRILSDIQFDLVGGDDRIQGLRIQVVENPTIADTLLDCKFPAYMERADRTLPATGEMRLPVGTSVRIRAKANKELVRLQIDGRIETGSSGDETRLSLVTLEPRQMTDDRRGFSHAVGVLDRNMRLLFLLSDTDGIKSRKPVQLKLIATPDEPPQLSVHLDGIGTAITAKARLPLIGQVNDDYGIDRIWAEAAIDQEPLPTQTIAKPQSHPTSHTLGDAAMEVQDLGVVAGQKLLVSVKASDLYNLKDTEDQKRPNIGSGERWLLDVVSADQLLTMLESRELVLRERFERIVQEMRETRELLSRMDFNPGGGEAAPSSSFPGSEPEDKAVQAKREISPLDLRTARVQQAQQNSRKDAQETLGVAESFDDVRKQLVNNRIDTEELKIRLEDGIAKPLHKISEDMFPEFDLRLQKLLDFVADAQRGPAERDRAYLQADNIILAMQQILDRMIELEDFNQVVDKLRAIIESQERVNESTKQRQKQNIRDIKED